MTTDPFPNFEDLVAPKPSGLYTRGDHERRGIPGIAPRGGVLGDLLRVPIDYMMEIHVDGRLERAISLPNTPSTMEWTRPGTSKIGYTLGRNPIRQTTQHRQLMIEVGGRSGLSFRSGYDRFGDLIYKSGPEIVMEFDAFLDYYTSMAARRGNDHLATPDKFRERRDSVVLIFRAFTERLHLRVEPTEWVISRDAARTRLTNEWKLMLQAYGPAEAKEPGNFLGPIAVAFELITQGINAMNNVVAAGGLLLTNARSDLEVLRGPLRELARTGTLIRSVAASVGDLAEFPQEFLADGAMVAAQFDAAFAEILNVEGIFTGSEESVRAVQETQAQAQETSILLVASMGAQGGGGRSFDAAVARAVDPQSAQGRPFPITLLPSEREQGAMGDMLSYTLQGGEDIRSVALRALGSASQWTVIASENNMLDAYTFGDGSPLRAGSVLMIPRSGLGQAPFSDPDGDGSGLFGRDLLLDGATRDLVLNEEGTDLLSVYGPDLLYQAIRERVQTRQGTSGAFPRFGLPIAPGDTLQASTVDYLAAHTREQLLLDPRIDTVDNFEVVSDGAQLKISLTVIPISGGEISILSPLQ